MCGNSGDKMAGAAENFILIFSPNGCNLKYVVWEWVFASTTTDGWTVAGKHFYDSLLFLITQF